MPFDTIDYISAKKELIDKRLAEIFPKSEDSIVKLHEAMRYSVAAGGKRLRPILCLAAAEAAEAVHGAAERAIPIACAIEMIHTYSLIHDDLPSMDDDSLRRGMPTNHKVFGEAAAILAGDALLTDAFALITAGGAKAGIPSKLIVEVISDISLAAGSNGMVMGQALDLVLEGRGATADIVERMHALKTGAILEASVTSGAKIAGATPEQIAMLREYAKCVGLSFQIIDDLLDIEGGAEIGKNTGADARKKKATYPSVLGVEKARKTASELTERAVRSLQGFGVSAEPLRGIALYLGGRRY
ncbi:MAG: polyprenyl synthetase family protein [Deltaproteobacteria bacterium]